MSGPDLKSIPLPGNSEQERPSQKMSAKEILDKALKEHKSSSKKETTNKENGTAVSNPPPVKNENSQHIVDELFKDFISKKMSKTSKSSSGQQDASTPEGGLTSLSEINRLLDIEISSIQAHAKDTPSTSQTGDDKKSTSTPANQKLFENQNTSSGPSQSVRTAKESTTYSSSTFVKQPSSSPKFSSDIVTNPQAHPTDQNQTDPNFHSGIQQQQQQQDHTSHLPRKLISNSASLSKKLAGPKHLGCKLSLQSMNLIQSTDRIDRKGRVWEEGEVLSSHSEESEKDKEASDTDHDDNLSCTGSIGSNEGDDNKQRSSKHKKKHKHKHKKKKKKSSKEKNRHKSSDGDRKKDSHRDKGQEKDSEDQSDGEAGVSGDKNQKDHDNEDHRSESASSDTALTKDRDKSGSRVDSKSSSRERDDSKRGEKEKSKKRKRDRSRSPKHHRKSKSHSRSRSRSPKKSRRESSPKRSSTRSQFNEWDARHYGDTPPKTDKGHSHSPEKSSSRKRSHSRDEDRDLRLKIDKAKLRKIAIANALNNLKTGQGPQVDMVTAKAGGKSVEELTDFCKRISEKDRDNEVSDSSEEEVAPKSDDDDELPIHHPFKVKDTSASNIIMNIRNAKQLPILTPSEKQAQQAALRLAFPVSSGSHHRASESEWVPVEKTKPVSSTTTTKAVTTQAAPIIQKTEELKGVFPETKDVQNIDISSIISERLQAVRKLQENPYDVQALSTIHKAQEKANQWATSKYLPGQFVGSTGAKVLSQQEIVGDKHHQAWAKKIVPTAVINRPHRAKCIPSQFTNAAPISGGIGLFLLQKMGWKHGEGLGKNNEGNKEPLQLDFKIDRKGLSTPLDNPKAKPQIINVPRAKDLSNKHPVSALMELCNRRHWGAPIFTIVMEDGPDHKKNFLFKVKVNNVEYQPTIPSSNKKSAKAQCAAVCLQEMGLIPRDAPLSY